MQRHEFMVVLMGSEAWMRTAFDRYFWIQRIRDIKIRFTVWKFHSYCRFKVPVVRLPPLRWSTYPSSMPRHIWPTISCNWLWVMGKSPDAGGHVHRSLHSARAWLGRLESFFQPDGHFTNRTPFLRRNDLRRLWLATGARQLGSRTYNLVILHPSLAFGLFMMESPNPFKRRF